MATGAVQPSYFFEDFFVGGKIFEGAAILLGSVSKIGKTTFSSLLTESEIVRIQNAATRIKKPITVVGSRANGTAKATSDWDYVIESMTSKEWSKIKNSLPGAPSRIDNLPGRIDIFNGAIDRTKAHITIYSQITTLR